MNQIIWRCGAAVLLWLTLCCSANAQAMNEFPYLWYYKKPFSGINLEGITTPWQLQNSSNLLHSGIHSGSNESYSKGAFDFAYANLLRQSYTSSFRMDIWGSLFGELEQAHEWTTKWLAWHSNIYWNDQKWDADKDGFLDMPRKLRTLNHIAISTQLDKHYLSGNVRHFFLQEQGGQTAFNPRTDYLTQQHYGTGLSLHHLNAGVNWLLDMGESFDYVRLRSEGQYQQQRQYFGQRLYRGQYYQVSSNFSFNWHAPNGFDQWLFGAYYQYEHTEEHWDSLQQHLLSLRRQEHQTGAVVQFQGIVAPRLRLNVRAEGIYHQLAGFIPAPSFSLDYSPLEILDFSFFVQGGGRYINPLTQYREWLLSARQVSIPQPLLPERAWTAGINAHFRQYVMGTHFYLNGELGGRYFTHKVVGDLDQDPHRIYIYNTKGAWQTWLELDASWMQSYAKVGTLVFNLDYRFDWLHQPMMDGQQRLPVLHPPHRWMLGARWLAKYIETSVSFLLASRQRLPDVSAKTNAYSTLSPVSSRLDMKITLPIYKYFKHWNIRLANSKEAREGKAKLIPFSLYLGVDNLLDMRQKNAFIAADTPFSPDFDGSLRWSSLVPRRWYLGFRWQVN